MNALESVFRIDEPFEMTQIDKMNGLSGILDKISKKDAVGERDLLSHERRRQKQRMPDFFLVRGK